MRKTKAEGWIELNASGALTRGLRLTLVALGIGLVMTTGVARAQEAEEDDDRPFEEKMIEKHHEPALPAPRWTTAASIIANGRRWWCLPGSICRRPSTASAEPKALRTGRKIRMKRKTQGRDCTPERKENKDPVEASPCPDAERTQRRPDRHYPRAPATIRSSKA